MWRIPATRMKMGEQHIVPVARQVVALLEQLQPITFRHNDTVAVEQRHGIDFHLYFAAALEKLQPLVEDGLAAWDGRHITATSGGRLLLRMIAMCFDRYLTDSSAVARPRYSRVI